MAYVSLPTLDQMAPPVREQLEAARAKTGDPGEIAYLVAIRPDIFNMTMVMVRTLLLTQTQLPFHVKESIALLVSVQNRCDMCIGEHVRIARLLGMSEEQVEAAIAGLDAMDVPDNERALLSFCVKAASKESYRITVRARDGRLLTYQQQDLNGLRVGDHVRAGPNGVFRD